ncbi:DUF5665 domain-containing protein [Primorskyibacter sp. S187A]|uniref:DUF5665 domain-containing protein n=1 Tax=Primorskyibacter sp. S187A TaxID=3415130 RepID=UPI003C79E147
MSDELREEVRALKEEVSKLRAHRFLRTYDSFPRLMAFSFARGLMVGLGGVIGATVLLSLLVWSLSQVEFIPIIGDWARQIAEIVQENGAN